MTAQQYSNKQSSFPENGNTLSLGLLLPLLAAMMAISPLAIDLYLPAMPILAEYLKTDMPMVQNSLSIYLLGYALGLLCFGPLSDKYSRRTLVLIGMSGFLLATLILPFSQNITQFLIIRFIQAFISSAATVVIPGTIREYYGKNTAKGLSYVSMIMMIAPMIAPSIGSLLLIHSWQMIFYILSAYSIIILILTAKYLPEKKHVNNQKEISFLGRYKVVLSHKKAQLNILTSMMISLSFFAYLTAIPFVYLTIFSVSEFMFSFLFALNVLGLITAHFINTRLITRKGSKKMLWFGLIVAIITASLLVIFSYLELSLIFTVIIVIPLMGGIVIVAVNSDALILAEFANEAGTATAVIGTLRFGIGALAGPILAYFFNGSAMPFALLMWGSVISVLIFQLFLSYKTKG